MTATYIYDRVWMYSDSQEIKWHFRGGVTWYNGLKADIPSGLLINHGYGDGYFNNNTNLADWVCIVEWDADSAPIVLYTVLAAAMWKAGIDASLIKENFRNAIFMAMSGVAYKIDSVAASKRIISDTYIFNREIL
jgi:hypothetical protein